MSDTEEGWVGTWRPHKPRGPVESRYGSPGPKYGLPTLTGDNQHDPTKSKAPMFSFGRRRDKSTSNANPGPNYLIPSNITRVGRDGTPSFSLYGRRKEPRSFQGPGPDKYSVDQSGKSIFRAAPAYSLSGRNKQWTKSQTDTPEAKECWVGTWRPHKPRGPVASLYGNPGPKYELPSLTGDNHHDPTRSKAPMFSFGRRREKCMSNANPGPNYLIPANITRVGRDGTPSFSLYGRRKEPKSFQGPGPDQYSIGHTGKSIFHTGPAYSLSGRSKQWNKTKIPVPTSYHLPSVGKST